jgi:hypothetical protein
MKELGDLISFLGTKSSHNSKEILDRVKIIKAKLDTLLVPESEKRKSLVGIIKKYDVLYINTIGITHYVLVHKVKDDKVYGVILSSTEAHHNVLKIKNDRFFVGAFATHTYISYPLDECIKRFSRVYENKREADEIFREVKKYYKLALSL